MATVAVFLFASPASAQNAASFYEKCAVRLASGGFFSSPKVVQGALATELVSIGTFDTDPELADALMASDSAAHYATLYESDHTWGTVWSFTGLGMLIFSAISPEV